MSGQVQQHVVQQVIVPAYVWQDRAQRQALLTHVGQSAARTQTQLRENLDVDNATVTAHGMKAEVAAAEVNGERVSFVAYDSVPVEHADLVMVAVDFPVVPS